MKSKKVPEIKWKITSIPIKVKTRKLSATWIIEPLPDMNCFGLDAERELSAILTEQMADEIERQILNINGLLEGVKEMEKYLLGHGFVLVTDADNKTYKKVLYKNKEEWTVIVTAEKEVMTIEGRCPSHGDKYFLKRSFSIYDSWISNLDGFNKLWKERFVENKKGKES